MAKTPDLQMTIELRLVVGALMETSARKGGEIAAETGLPLGIVESSLTRLERHARVVPSPETADKHPLDRRWSLTRIGYQWANQLAKGTPEVAPIVPIARKHRRGDTD